MVAEATHLTHTFTHSWSAAPIISLVCGKVADAHHLNRPMPHLTMTTTAHRSELSTPVDLLDEALALAQRVTHKIRTPLPAATQPPLEDGEYEPQSWVPPPVTKASRRSYL